MLRIRATETPNLGVETAGRSEPETIQARRWFPQVGTVAAVPVRSIAAVVEGNFVFVKRDRVIVAGPKRIAVAAGPG